MFTWICPKCGSEVLPSETECQQCAGKRAAPTQEAETPPVPTMAPSDAKYVLPPPPQGLPKWLMLTLALLGLALVSGLGYMFFSGGKPKPAPAPAKIDLPGTATKQHPFAKFVEVTGLRVSEDAKKNVRVKLMVVNHSLAELPEMELAVTLKPTTAKPGDEPFCSLTVAVPSLGPHESGDVEATAKTKMRAYEMPDWEFLKADYEIVAPKQ